MKKFNYSYMTCLGIGLAFIVLGIVVKDLEIFTIMGVFLVLSSIGLSFTNSDKDNVHAAEDAEIMEHDNDVKMR